MRSILVLLTISLSTLISEACSLEVIFLVSVQISLEYKKIVFNVIDVCDTWRGVFLSQQEYMASTY